MKDTEFEELGAAAIRQGIDAGKVFAALEDARREAQQVRGGMYWHKGPKQAPEQSYLVRTTAAGGETSLGRRSAETEALYSRFTERKAAAQERLRQLRQAMEQQRRLNRALRIGRCEPLVVQLLNQLTQSGLAEHFRVVGTHALYAFEAEAGVRLQPGALATRDIDLLWDVRRRLRFATQLKRVDRSMLGVLRKVDPSFRLRDDQRYTAVNQDGFEVDILRREQAEDDPHPIRLSQVDEDFWVVQARQAQQLLDAPAFSALITATDGSMARMHTLHPLAFARFKRWMAEQADREAPRRRRDALQADLVECLVRDYLPQWA
jgi:hypothetical protein